VVRGSRRGSGDAPSLVNNQTIQSTHLISEPSEPVTAVNGFSSGRERKAAVPPSRSVGADRRVQSRNDLPGEFSLDGPARASGSPLLRRNGSRGASGKGGNSVGREKDCSPQTRPVRPEHPPEASSSSSRHRLPRYQVSVVARRLRKLLNLLEQVPPTLGTYEPWKRCWDFSVAWMGDCQFLLSNNAPGAANFSAMDGVKNKRGNRAGARGDSEQFAQPDVTPVRASETRALATCFRNVNITNDLRSLVQFSGLPTSYDIYCLMLLEWNEPGSGMSLLALPTPTTRLPALAFSRSPSRFGLTRS
jgi:hypothetical protein